MRDLEHMLVLTFPVALKVLIRLFNLNVLAKIVTFSALAVAQYLFVEILVCIVTFRPDLLYFKLQRHVILEVVNVQYVC